MSAYISSGERKLSLEELGLRAARAATGFAELGVVEGDSVALLLRNDLPFVEAATAAGLLGAYPVPMNWHFKGEEAGYVIADCGANVVVVHADLLGGLDGHMPDGVTVLAVAAPPEIQAAYGISDDAARVPAGLTVWEDWRDGFTPWQAPALDARGSMIYTSGTTGRPKGVRRDPATPEMLELMMARVAVTFGVRPGARTVMTGPLYHSAPNAYGRVTLMAGASMILTPRFDAEELLRLIDEEKITHLHMVPTMFIRLLRLPEDARAKYDLSSLEHVIHGAAPCPPEVKRAMIEWWGPVIHEYYGSTEVGLISAASSAEWLSHPGTVGRALDGVTIRVYGEDGRPAPAGEAGEIYVSLENLNDFTYHNDDAKRRSIERDGMVTNGDIGYFDADGYLYLRDRKNDMVISGGVNIYPAEIESVLIHLDGVRDCAVFGIPDSEYGEALAAAIEPASGARLDDNAVRSYLSQHLAKYKVPKVVTFHDAMPREDSGKIFKRRLREPYWRDAGRQI